MLRDRLRNLGYPRHAEWFIHPDDDYEFSCPGGFGKDSGDGSCTQFDNSVVDQPGYAQNGTFFLGLKTLHPDQRTLFKIAQGETSWNRTRWQMNSLLWMSRPTKLFSRGEDSRIPIWNRSDAGNTCANSNRQVLCGFSILPWHALYRRGPLAYIPSFIKESWTRSDWLRSGWHERIPGRDLWYFTRSIQEQVMFCFRKMHVFLPKGEADVLPKGYVVLKSRKDVFG